MKTRFLALSLGALAVVVGCVSTVNDRSTPGFPIGKDKLENRYERSLDQTYKASVDVIRQMGTVARESTINPGTNEVKTVEGKVTDRKVWVRVQSVDPKITAVTVQVRTPAGGTDITLTHDIATRIALELTR
jgi:Protein of unknown function (DUF3568)